MHWTTTKPSVPGWYWWRMSASLHSWILHLGMMAREVEGPEILCTDQCDDQNTPGELGGEWWGPLRPPTTRRT